MRQDPEAMLAWVDQRRIDALDCTPSLFKLLLDAGFLEQAHVPAICFIGGEAMDEVTWRTLAATDRTRAYNAYGPTEGTVASTTECIQRTAQPTPVIGRPREAGEAVELVAMIDSYVPQAVPDSEPDLDRALAVGLFAQDLMGVSLVGERLESHELPGTHHTLLREPVVQSVAELLAKALRDADTK
ncbi:AMP-binding protein [Corallococcus coralloides]|uniref:AMP-binding protein n=1 Tax=Corallococcus coralloides TaxID=184914 RepID=UPI00384C3803